MLVVVPGMGCGLIYKCLGNVCVLCVESVNIKGGIATSSFGCSMCPLNSELNIVVSARFRCGGD